MKVIEIMEDGFIWHIPLQVIAEARARHYANDKDTTFKEEVEYVMDDDFEGIDWYLNNMDFEDVAEHARLVQTPQPKKVPGPDAACHIIETAYD